jgi:hypothetical protein
VSGLNPLVIKTVLLPSFHRVPPSNHKSQCKTLLCFSASSAILFKMYIIAFLGAFVIFVLCLVLSIHSVTFLLVNFVVKKPPFSAQKAA